MSSGTPAIFSSALANRPERAAEAVAISNLHTSPLVMKQFTPQLRHNFRAADEKGFKVEVLRRLTESTPQLCR